VLNRLNKEIEELNSLKAASPSKRMTELKPFAN
jgi:hypothetical protein